MFFFQRHLHLLTITFILLVGFFLRIYGINDNLEWRGDTARDILIAKHIVENKESLLLRPAVGAAPQILKNSPFYYNLLAFFWLTTRSPHGVTFCHASLSMLSIFFIYLSGKILGGKTTGLIATLLSSFSYKLIDYSKTVFQPYFTLFFFSAAFFFLVRSLSKKSFFSLFLSALFYSLSVHIHYSSLMFLPSFIFWGIYSLYHLSRSWPKKKKVISCILFFIYLLGLIILWFSLTYQPFSDPELESKPFFAIIKSLYKNNEVSLFLPNIKQSLFWIFEFNFNNLLIKRILTITMAFLTILGLTKLVTEELKKNQKYNLLLLSFILTITLVGFLWKEVSFWYLIPYYPLLYLTWSYIIIKITPKPPSGLFLSVASLTIFVFIGSESFITTPYIEDFQRMEYVSMKISEDYQNNLLSVSETNNNDQQQLIKKIKPNFGLYTIRQNGSKYAWDTPQFWYFLEESFDQKLIQLTEEYNNISPLVTDPHYLYLICLEYNNEKLAKRDCLEYFLKRDEGKEWLLDQQILGFSKINPNYSVFRLKKGFLSKIRKLI